MDLIVLVSCVAAAFLISFVLYFTRSARLEVKLDELDRLLRLVVRDRERPSDGESQEEVRAELHALRSLLETTRGEIGSLRDVGSESQFQRIHDLVERKLYNMGYETVNVAAGGDEPAPGSPFRVNFEASRRGASYKGYALVRDGVIVDSRINPIYSMFP
jgi:hypothetical protein